MHELPDDLREALVTNPAALGAWKDITPLARNEFICWVEPAAPAASPGLTISRFSLGVRCDADEVENARALPRPD